MTEIKIEKKKLLWPWILLGIVIVALIIYFLVFQTSSEEVKEVTETTDLISVKENNTTVEAYVSFIEIDTNRMTLDHTYTNEALLKLTDAANAMAGEIGYDVKADLEKVREHAKMITKDAFDTSHADSIRKAADILTNVLQNIQKAKYPGLTNEVTELKNASATINPAVLTLDQRDEVKSFFSKAAVLLKKMN